MENKYLKQYLTDNLRALQCKELEILKEIDRICRKHNIDYWLDGGTCLGAVRHGGFIPWDDDIDIAMRKEDLARFEIIAPRELPPHLFLQTQESDPSRRLPITKVRDLNSYCVEAMDDFTQPYQKGVFVDIFPFINYPDVSRQFVKTVVGGINKSMAVLSAKHTYSWRSVAEFFYFHAKKLWLMMLWRSANLLRNTDTYMCNILVNNGYGITHRKDCIFPTKDILFEGIPFKAPRQPDVYLTDLYKDYMQLPPVDKRKVHGIFFMTDLV